MESAVDEFLRYESPIQKIGRWTREEVEVAGRRIPAGRYVVSLFGAANRDPLQFPQPDRLDLGRHHGTSLAFGKGIHHRSEEHTSELQSLMRISSAVFCW